MSCTGTDLRLARALRELGTVLVKEAVRGAGRLASPLRDGGVRAQVARSDGVFVKQLVDLGCVVCVVVA
jgi:hypothetical protein